MGINQKVICSKIATGSKHIREFPTLFVYNSLMCVLSRFKNLCLPIQAQLGLDLMLFEYLIRSVVYTHIMLVCIKFKGVFGIVFIGIRTKFRSLYVNAFKTT